MNKKEIGTKGLTTEETLKTTQDLVQEFIQTKQKMLIDERKLNVIGRTLIEQKKSLDEVHKVQSSHGKKLTDSLDGVVDRQDEIYKEVLSVSESMDSLQEINNRQQNFQDELKYFKDKHSALEKASLNQSNNSISRLEVISTQIINLYQYIEDIDIEDRVIDITERTSEINSILKEHANAQEEAREEGSKEVLNLLAEVTSFKRQLSDEGMTGQLKKIKMVSEDNNNKIKTLNEKFDIFVEIYELSKIENNKEKGEMFKDDFDSEDLAEVSDLEKLFLEGELKGNSNDENTPELDNPLTNLQDEEDCDIIENENGQSSEGENILVKQTQVINETGELINESCSIKNFTHLNDLEVEELCNDIIEDVEGVISSVGSDLIEIPEYDRIEDGTNADTNNEEKKKGFFGRLFGGR